MNQSLIAYLHFFSFPGLKKTGNAISLFRCLYFPC